MNKTLLGLFFPLMFASLLHALPPGVVSIPFTTSQAQFLAGDFITIQEVFAGSSTLAPGATVVVRGTYTLASRASAYVQVQLTSSGPGNSYSPPRLNITTGSGTFELEHVIQQVGTLHVTFYPSASGSSFGGIYFASAPSTGQPSTPATPSTPVTPVVVVPISTAGLSSVPFATSQAKFEGGDSLTIQEVLASSPRWEPGDTVVVRGQYSLQSRAQALLLISLTANAPGATESISANARKTVSVGAGTFELAYEIKQPGALHVSFYPAGSGSSFGGVYFSPPGAASAAGSNTVAITNPAANTGKLANLSIRSLVGPAEGALIAGMTVTDQERYVVIRAIGPSLAAFGVSGVLRKPLVSVYNVAGDVIASAGSWTTAFSGNQRTGIQMLMSSVGAFPLTVGADDAVLNLRLVPGGYTVMVTTGDGQPGVALLEIYASSTYSLPPPL